MSVQYDQRVLNESLKELLYRCDSSTWPRTINKKGFFVTLSALKYTERADKEKIQRELLKEINTPHGSIPIGLAIASKRASKGWVGQGNIKGGYSKREKAKAMRQLSIKAWRSRVGKKLTSMMKGRGISSGFLKSGWVKVLQELGPKVGGRYDRSLSKGVNVRGSAKGHCDPAEPGKLQVIIENSAAARSEHHGGFIRIGQPALDRGVAEEARKTQEYLDDMKPDIEHFNRRQH